MIRVNVAHEKIFDVDLIKFKGKLTNATTKKFSNNVYLYVKQNCHVILDMTDCEFISNAGFKFLVLLDRDILSKWGKLVIVGLNQEIIETMNLTGFENIFSIYSNVYEVFDAWKIGGKYAKNR